jgi:hypothetical protein
MPRRSFKRYNKPTKTLRNREVLNDKTGSYIVNSFAHIGFYDYHYYYFVYWNFDNEAVVDY